MPTDWSKPVLWLQTLKGLLVLPTNERQLRPLTKLEPDEQRQAWESVLQDIPDNSQITARHVENAVNAMRGIAARAPDQVPVSPMGDMAEHQSTDKPGAHYSAKSLPTKDPVTLKVRFWQSVARDAESERDRLRACLSALEIEHHKLKTQLSKAIALMHLRAPGLLAQLSGTGVGR